MLQSCGARSPAQASRSPAVCHRRGTSPVTWSSAIASGRRADSADKKASVDGFPPLGGAPHACCPVSRNDAMVEHDCEADADGALPSGRKPSTDALMAEQCEDADVDGRSSWSSDWIKAGIA